MRKIRSIVGKISIMTAVILLSYLIPQIAERTEAAQERYSTEVQFQFKYEQEKARVIPQVVVLKTDFDNGNIEKIVHEFPEQALSVSKEAQDSKDAEEKDDPSLTKTFFNCSQSSYDTHIIDLDGPQALNTYCNVTRDKKPDVKGKYKVHKNNILYKYDINRNLLTILNKFETNGNDNMGFYLYQKFGGYAIIDRNSYRDYDKKQNQIYSLSGNKLLLRTAEPPRVDMEKGTISYIDYTKVPSKPKKLAANESYFSTSNGNYISASMILHPDGTRTKDYFSFVPSKIKEEKVGAFTFVEYPNPNGKGNLVGYRTSKGYKVLSRNDVSSTMEITKHKKYILIREKKGKEKNLIFVDTKTAKVVWKIPDMDGRFFEEVGDSIFLFSKDYKDYYLHLPTGIVTRNLNIVEQVQSDESRYVGSQSKLVTLQTPPQMFVNGKQVHYSGQGLFLTYGTRWYVEVNDFAKAVDAKVTQNSDGFTINRDKYIMTISNKDATVLNWAGQTFVQLEMLNTKLGMAGGFLNIIDSEGYTERSLHLFSKDLEEKDVITQPDIFVPDNKANLSNYYVMENGKPTQRSSEEVTAYVSGGVYLIFKDGKLINIATGPNSYLLTLRNFNFDIGKYKDIVALYGKPQTTNVGNYDVNWYKVEGNVLVFEGNSAAYYIMQ